MFYWGAVDNTGKTAEVFNPASRKKTNFNLKLKFSMLQSCEKKGLTKYAVTNSIGLSVQLKC